MKKNAHEFECNVCKYDFSIENIGLLASLSDTCDFNDMICYCKVCMIKRLEEMLTEMKVPKVKHTDYDWLLKVIPISYGYHQHFKEVSLILTSLRRSMKMKRA